MEQIVTAQFERQTAEQRVNRFESENASWLYGVDPQSGGQVLTPKGQAFYNEIATLREGGITDPQVLLQLATRLVGATTVRTNSDSCACSDTGRTLTAACARSPGQSTSCQFQPTGYVSAKRFAAGLLFSAGWWLSPARTRPSCFRQ